MTATVTRIADRTDEQNYPLGNTRATRMFNEGLVRLERNSGMSQRSLAKQLGYKSSVVISHMANGRAPIPLERAMDFVRALDMDPREFLLAVLDQRHPHIDFARYLTKAPAGSAARSDLGEDALIMEDLQSAAGMPLANLPPEQFAVVREAAADRNAKRRWMKVSEMSIMDMFRSERPDVLKTGLTLLQRKQLKEAIVAL